MRGCALQRVVGAAPPRRRRLVVPGEERVKRLLARCRPARSPRPPSPCRPRSPSAASGRARGGTRSPLGQVDAVGALGKQVDRRRAEQREVLRADRAVEPAVVRVSSTHDLDLGAVAAANRSPSPLSSTNRNALRQREILLQQAVALERRAARAATAPLRRRSRRAAIGFSASRAARARAASSGARRSPRDAGHDLLVDPHRRLVGAADEQRQPSSASSAKRRPAGRVQRSRIARRARAAGSFTTAGTDVSDVLGVGQLQRPQRHVVRGPVLAGGLLAARRAGCAAPCRAAPR